MSGLLLENRNAVIYGGGGAIGGGVPPGAAPGGKVEAARVDVFDQPAVEKHAEAVAATAGSIDIALNAVSVMHDQGTLLADLSLEEFMLPIDGFLRTLFITR